jgi:hypothetical protein
MAAGKMVTVEPRLRRGESAILISGEMWLVSPGVVSVADPITAREKH